MAQEMYATKNIPIKFSDPEYQEFLLAHVYQALVRYTDMPSVWTMAAQSMTRTYSRPVAD